MWKEHLITAKKEGYVTSKLYIAIISSIILASRVAQWKRAGPITQRSVDRNHSLLSVFISV